MLGVVAVVAALAKGREVIEPIGLGRMVVDMRGRQDDARTGNRMRAAVNGAAPLTLRPSTRPADEAG